MQFIPYQAAQIAALRGLIAAWMRIAIFEAMSRPEGDQRLWFVVDELDALGNIDGLKDALARLRKFGGRCVCSDFSRSRRFPAPTGPTKPTPSWKTAVTHSSYAAPLARVAAPHALRPSSSRGCTGRSFAWP